MSMDEPNPIARLRDPRDPCRRGARSDDRRAHHADLSDHGLCVRRRRPRGLALQSADLRLHLFAPHQPDRLRAGGARGEPRGRARRDRVRLGPRGADARLLPLHGAGRPSSSPRSKLYGGSITQFGRSFKKFDWHVRFVDPDEPENFRRAMTPQMPGDLHREPRQSRRRRRRPRGASPRSRTRPACC